jgi:cysteine desulfurase/selenocysteine lyase
MNDTNTFALDAIRAQFPMLGKTMNGKPLCYLDSAATSLKPDRVVDRLSRFYREEYATVRRGAYALSHASTAMFEAARVSAARFIGASRPEEVVFVRGCTEGINLVAIALGWSRFKPGDEILVSTMEHHSNIVPWQLVASRTGAVVKPIPITDTGELDLDAYRALLSPRTRLVSIVHVSNGLGTVNPVTEVTRLAHEAGALVLVDGAQSTPHMPIDVQAIGCDFFVASGHKMYGPTGIGLLYGRYDLLASMDPYQGGGEMIDRVSFDGTTYDDPPHRFEAGTPAFAQAIGLAESIAWLEELGMDQVHARGQEILRYATERMQALPGLQIVGEAREKSGLVSFVVDGIHPSDIGAILDQEGIAIRVGQHCVQPIMDRFGIHSTARASFGVYTSEVEVDRFIDGLHVVRDMLL